MSAYVPGQDVTAKTTFGVELVLARVTGTGVALCLEPHCGCPVQRRSSGDLRDGVRAHYRTVHPEKGVQ